MNETDKAVESEPRNVVVSLNFIIIIIIIFHSFFLSSFFLFCDFFNEKNKELRVVYTMFWP